METWMRTWTGTQDKNRDSDRGGDKRTETGDGETGWEHGMEQRDMGTGDTPQIGMETGKGAWGQRGQDLGTGVTPSMACVPISQVDVPTPGARRVGRTLWGIVCPPPVGPPWPQAGGMARSHPRWWPVGAGRAQSCSGVASACCPRVPNASQGCVTSGLAEAGGAQPPSLS